MKRTTLKQTLPLTFAAVTAGSLFASQNAQAATPSVTYKGTTVSERWGSVQVSIVVKSKRITNVKVAYTDETPRSQFITTNALPALKQEVLQSQSASINTVSGATDVSQAYIASLQSAVKKAISAKRLTTAAL